MLIICTCPNISIRTSLTITIYMHVQLYMYSDRGMCVHSLYVFCIVVVVVCSYLIVDHVGSYLDMVCVMLPTHSLQKVSTDSGTCHMGKAYIKGASALGSHEYKDWPFEREAPCDK